MPSPKPCTSQNHHRVLMRVDKIASDGSAVGVQHMQNKLIQVKIDSGFRFLQKIDSGFRIQVFFPEHELIQIIDSGQVSSLQKMIQDSGFR